MKLLNKLICKFKGHYWVYRSPHNTGYKICNRCGKTLRDFNTEIIDGKLVSKEEAYGIWFGYNDVEETHGS